MKWEGGRQSDNVEDRRGDGGSGGGGRGGGMAKGGIGVILIAVVAMFLGIDPSMVLGLLGGGGQPAPSPQVSQQTSAQRPPEGDQMAKFVSVVLADTEDTWTGLFKQSGSQYKVPKLVLFRGAVQSACGRAEAAMGPFYCPGDQKVYIDLAFFDDLQRRFQAPGEFARAYVIAHEVGPHVQNLLGIACPKSNTTSCRCAWSCRRIAWRASGRITPTVRAISLSGAMLKRPWRRPPPSAMIACNSNHAATSRRNHSPTARRSSAYAGSAADWIADRSRSAIRFRRGSFNTKDPPQSR